MTELALNSDVAATLKRSARRRSIGIKVQRGEVVVSAPTAVPVAEIEFFLRQKRHWIERHLARQRHNLSLRREMHYACGEQVQLLARALTLRISTPQRPAQLIGDTLHLGVASDELQQRKAALQCWYVEQARRHLLERIAHYQPLLKVHARAVKVRHYKSRWGSCNHRGELQFNWLLMMAPPAVVDYVVVHELAHLRHFNHSAAFWQLVASVLPDYAAHRQWLKNQSTLFW